MSTHILHVWGEGACFTRPEMKSERVSYDVITPSAARAVFEAIFWKPALRWVIERIDVLKPIEFMTIRRNEVSDKASPRKETFYIEESRTQRATTFLKDVGYLLHARMEFTPECLEKEHNAVTKYNEMFVRRSSKGQCVMQPYLGCREFPAYFERVEDMTSFTPLAVDRELGFMLYDIDYKRDMTPQFFRASLQQGRLIVPAPKSEELVS